MPAPRTKKKAVSASDGGTEPVAQATETTKPAAKKVAAKASAAQKGRTVPAKGKGGRKRKSVEDSDSEDENRKKKDSGKKGNDDGESPSPPEVSTADFPPGGIRLGLSRKVSKPLHPGLLRRSRRGAPT